MSKDLYPARTAYQSNAAAESYDIARFRGVLKSFLNKCELAAFQSCLQRVGAFSSALDVAAGTGRITSLLTSSEARVLALDVSPAMLSLNRSGSPIVGDAETLPFADEAFDVVSCVRLFGHLPPNQRRTILAEMTRVSRDYIVVAQYHRRLSAPVKDLMHSLCGRNPAPRFLVSDSELRQDFDSLGLQEVYRRETFPQFSGVIHLLKRIRPSQAAPD